MFNLNLQMKYFFFLVSCTLKNKLTSLPYENDLVFQTSDIFVVVF